MKREEAKKRAAAESAVLLKNDGILPIRNVSSPKGRGEYTIAVIGPNANSRAALVGNYHGTSSRYITVLEGIQDRAEREGCRVYYSEGCHLFINRVEDLALHDSSVRRRISFRKASRYFLQKLRGAAAFRGLYHEGPDLSLF